MLFHTAYVCIAIFSLAETTRSNFYRYEPNQKPNIVYIMADDLGEYFTGFFLYFAIILSIFIGEYFWWIFTYILILL